MQVRFALSSSPIFSRSDLATDSERFYNTILDLFEDDEEEEEVNDLFAWWNRYSPTLPRDLTLTFRLFGPQTGISYLLNT